MLALLALAVPVVQGVSQPMTTTDERQDPALAPPPILTSHLEQYAEDRRIFQGIPGLERAANGRLWATWYGGGPTEGPWNYVMLVTSEDDGKTWSGLRMVIAPPGDVRAFDPCLWIDPEGHLWLFWAQAWELWDGRGGVWAMSCPNPEEASPAWSAPRRLCNGIMMNKPTALSTGQWLLPAAVWPHAPHPRDPARRFDLGEEKRSNVVGSRDQGQTWELLGGADVPGRACDEHMVVELGDGRLWMLVRTGYGVGQSFSSDGGHTWSPGGPSWIPHIPAARFLIRRLSSGKLLLVKHTPPDGKTRAHLTAHLSADDGRCWYGGLLLDERAGVSYPDGVQAPDGTIYLIYDYSRQGEKQILMATFTEEDVAAEADVSGKVRLRVLVNQATGVAPVQERRLASNEDGKELPTGSGAQVSLEGGQSDKLVPGVRLFTDRQYQAAKLPPELDGCEFIRASLEGSGGVCEEAGVAYVLTPLPERNRDSIELGLRRQGFDKARLPEFQLFDSSEGNIVSVFHKRLERGEKVELGKWGVLVLPGR